MQNRICLVCVKYLQVLSTNIAPRNESEPTRELPQGSMMLKPGRHARDGPSSLVRASSFAPRPTAIFPDVHPFLRWDARLDYLSVIVVNSRHIWLCECDCVPVGPACNPRLTYPIANGSLVASLASCKYARIL